MAHLVDATLTGSESGHETVTQDMKDCHHPQLRLGKFCPKRYSFMEQAPLFDSGLKLGSQFWEKAEKAWEMRRFFVCLF